MKHSVTIILLQLLLLASCKQAKENQSTSNEHASDSIACAVQEDDLHSKREKAKIRLHQAIRCIVQGDAAGFASRVAYPLLRPQPLQAIKDSAELVRCFDALFDKDVREKWAHATTADWYVDPMTWHLVFNDGEMSGYGSGFIFRLNYISPTEQKAIADIRKLEQSSFHPSLRGAWCIDYCFRNLHTGSILRIDRTTNDYSDSIPNIPSRICIYHKGTALNASPDRILYGDKRIEGAGHFRVYSFHDTVKDEIVLIENGDEDEFPFTLIEKQDKRYENEEFEELRWLDIVPSTLVETP